MRDIPIPEGKEAKNTWFQDAFFSVPRPPDWQQILFATFQIDGTTYEVFLHLNRNEVTPVDTAYLTCFNKRYPIISIAQIQTDVSNRLEELRHGSTL